MSTVPEIPLSHTERARAVLEHIRGIKELIGGFAFPTDRDQPRSLNATKSLPDAFLEMVAVAIEATEDLARTGRVTPAELRDVVSFAVAFTPVAEELGMMHHAVIHTIALKRASVSQLALQVYQYAKTLVRKTLMRPVLIPHFENMQRALGRVKPKPVLEPAVKRPALPPAKTQGGSNA